MELGENVAGDEFVICRSGTKRNDGSVDEFVKIGLG
jgi:hypothetical protein